MIFRWLKRRRDAAERISDGAEALIGQFGDSAYGEARRRAIEARDRTPAGPHWNKVRREIGRRTGRVYVDTATRYFEQ